MMRKIVGFGLAMILAFGATVFSSVGAYASTTDPTVALSPPENIGFCFRTLVDAGYIFEDIQSMFESEVIRLVNEIRAENGLSALRLHDDLADVARHRAEEKLAHDARGHISPTTGLEHTAHARAMGLNLAYAGENAILAGRTPQEVVDVWMASNGHRQFILSGHSTSRFTRPLRYIGVGFSFDDRNFTAWTLWKTCGSPAR